MANRGFTLIEILVVVALIGTLLGIATLNFSQYVTKAGIANQTRLMYGDLMEYHTKALFEKKKWTFKFSSNLYGIYSSADTSVAPVATVTLKYPITYSNTGDIVYVSHGLASLGKTICVAAENNAVVDSVVVSETRVQVGKKKPGMECTGDKIDAK